MKNFIVLVAVLIVTLQAGAQQYYGYRSSEAVGGLYYSPIIYGPNGYRTVEEENRLMEQTLAELRWQHHLDSMSANERAAAEKQRKIKQEIRMDAAQARKQREEEAAKKKQKR